MRHSVKQIIREEVNKAIQEELSFNQRLEKVATLRNAILAHLRSEGGHIDRRKATESDPSFDNLVLRIIDMADWD